MDLVGAKLRLGKFCGGAVLGKGELGGGEGDTFTISEPRLGMEGGGFYHRGVLGRGDSLPQLAAGGSNKGSVHTL